MYIYIYIHVYIFTLRNVLYAYTMRVCVANVVCVCVCVCACVLGMYLSQSFYLIPDIWAVFFYGYWIFNKLEEQHKLYIYAKWLSSEMRSLFR